MSVPYALYAGKSDTSVLNLTSRLVTKLNVTDTAFLSNRIDFKLTKTDTVFLSDRIDLKLTKTDTASLSNRIDLKLTKTDTFSLSDRIDFKLTKTDTVSLSNRIDFKLTKTDTVSLSDRIDFKLTKTDTASLSNRIDDKLTKTDTSFLSNRIDLKLTKTDTAFLSNRIDGKLTKTDTADMLSTYLRKTDAIITDLQNQLALLVGLTTLVDIDGNSYSLVIIGNQIWMKENLRVRRYNDNSEIKFDNSGGTSGNFFGQTWSGLTYGAYTLYSNDSTTTPSNLNKYGYLYNWYAVKGISTTGSITYKNICPIGWHVPSDTDWTALTTYLGGESGASASGKMKSIGTAYWNSPNTAATNQSGFSVFPGGGRDNGGFFNGIRTTAYFWSATEDDTLAWYRGLGYEHDNVDRYTTFKSFGASVRCLKDFI